MTKSSPELPDLPLIGADELPPPGGPGRSRGRLRLLALPVIAAGCFAAGVAGSLAAAGGLSAEDPPEVAERHEALPHVADAGHHEPTPEHEDGHPAPQADDHHAAAPADKPAPHADGHHDHKPTSQRERIDLAAGAGRFADALEMLRHGPVDHLGMDERAVAYREGVCLEGLGDYKGAVAAYAKAADPVAPGWADLGRARCLLAAGDQTTARALLNTVSLVAGSDGHRLGECLQLRARLLLLGHGPLSAPEPLDAEALAWPMPPSRGEHTLAHLGDDHPHSPEADHRPEAVAVHRSFWLPEHPGVTALVRNRPAATFFDGLRAAGLVVRIDPAAADRLNVPVTIALDHAPLAVALTALGESLGFGWRLDGEDVVLGLQAGQDDPADALRRAVGFDPDHPFADAARVALGNLHADAGRWPLAADEYRRFLDRRANAPEAVHAAYNLGLAELRDGHGAAARARFLDVIDRGPRAAWADLGRWWVARTHLDAGDTAAARKPLMMAFGGQSKDVRSAAALGRVAADLLDGDADAARSLLRTTRFGTGAAHAATAGWFDALLRYRAVPTDGRAAEVMALLAEGDDGRPLGAAGVYLAGRAYHEAGRPDRTVAVYDRGAGAFRGPLAVRMTLAAAEHLADLDLRGPARQRLLAVATVDPVGLGLTAELRLAELSARDGRGAECVARCRRLLARPGADPADVLPVMARGYELAGRHRAAADCLAGRVPGE